MKRSIQKISVLLVLLVLAGGFNQSKAQISDVGAIFQAGINDANLLGEQYMSPFASGVTASMNSGWFLGAGTHSVLGFDVTFRINTALIPTSSNSFNVEDVNPLLERLDWDPSSSLITPTLFGENSPDNPTAYSIIENVNGTNQEISRFNMPGGINFGFVPTPSLQVGLGLPMNTDVTVRFIPETSLADFGDMSMWGVGLKHGINQYLPGGALLPIDLSIQGAYSSFDIGSDLTINPGDVANDLGSPGGTKNTFPASTWEGQRVEATATAWNVNLLVGKSLPLITVYAGLGYEQGNLTMVSPGSFPIKVPNANFSPTNDPYLYEIDALEEPLDLDMDGGNNVRVTVGARLKLFLIGNIMVEYTQAEFSTVSAGVAISFR